MAWDREIVSPDIRINPSAGVETAGVSSFLLYATANGIRTNDTAFKTAKQPHVHSD